MSRGLTRRLLYDVGQLLFVTWGAVTIVFFVGRVLPADPAILLSGAGANAEVVAATRHALGLDQPLYAQYAAYLGKVVHGELGRSAITGREVVVDLGARFPATLEMVVAALGLALALSLVLAVLAAAKPESPYRRIGDGLASLGTAMPTFLVGVVLVLLFYVVLPVAPAPLGRLDVGISAPRHVSGLLVVDSLIAKDWAALLSALRHLVLPSVTLALSIFPQLFRVLYTGLEKQLRSEALTAVRLSRVPNVTVWRRYVIPPALGPALTLLAASFGYLIGGTVLVEQIFGWNGLGSYVVDGINAGDYNVVQGVVLVAAAAYALGFFAVDLILWRIDPRIAAGEEGARVRHVA